MILPMCRSTIVAARAADLPADARRLLHQRPALRLAEHRDGRQPDQRDGADPGRDRLRRRVRDDRARRVADPDALLRPLGVARASWWRHEERRRHGGATRGASRGSCSPSPSATCCGRCCRSSIAVLFSFNNGRRARPGRASRCAGTGATRCARCGTTPACTPPSCRRSSSACITTLITVPLGVLFAIGIDRWRGRLPEARERADAAVVRHPRDAARGRRCCS